MVQLRCSASPAVPSALGFHLTALCPTNLLTVQVSRRAPLAKCPAVSLLLQAPRGRDW